MKKLIFSALALMSFAVSTFANESKVEIATEVQVETITVLNDRSGSYTYVDSCGDEYTINWTCTGECSITTVIAALQTWERENTCGAGGTTSNWQE